MTLLRKEGWNTVASVDRWDSFTRRSYDLFGCIDVLAIGGDGTLAVQVTSRGNMAARRTKIEGADALEDMLDANWDVQVWGWDQPEGPGTHFRLKRQYFDHAKWRTISDE